MAKVLFTSLPWLGKIFSAKEGHRWSYTSSKTPIISFEAFPFYLAYAAANLKKFGHEVSVIYDHKYNNMDLYPKYLKEIKKLQPDIIVSEISTPSYINDQKVAKDIKQIVPNSKICFTGQHANALPEEVLKENEGIIDHVLVGEYEFTSLEIANGKREDDSPLQPIMKNLKLHEIDSIPWPARELFDMSQFNDTFCSNFPNIHILFSRGCFFSCLTADTLITMADKTTIRIDKFIKKPKPVLSYDFATKKIVPSKIYATQVFERNNLIEIETEADQKLRLTTDHPVYTKGGWLEAGDLKKKDSILFIEPELTELIWSNIKSIKKIKLAKPIKVYDMTNNNHNFFANNILVHNCSYCNIHLSNDSIRRQRVRNIHDVVAEMKFCVEKYRPKEFWIEDDIFNGSEEKVREFCRVKIQEGVNTPFSALCHAKIQRETLEIMKMAGCTGIKFGMESADAQVLLRLKKGLTLDMVKKTLQNCKELDIRTHLTFAIGLPGDTEETIKKTLRFAQNAGTAYQVSIATPFPGTPLYEEAKKNGWLNFNSWEDFDGLNKALINYPTLSAETLYKYYLLAQDSTYKKVFTSGDYKKYIKMIYQERGITGLLNLVKRPDIIRSVWKSIIGTKRDLKLSAEAEKSIDLDTFADKPQQSKQEIKPITAQV